MPHHSAVTPAQQQYQGDAHGTGSLPFTGLDLGLVLAVGLVGIVMGTLIRKRAA